MGIPIYVLLVIVGGVTMTFPILLEGWPTSPWTWPFFLFALLCALQIVWNYAACAFVSPGSPNANVSFGSEAAAQFGRLKDFELCRRCAVPRPRGRAHHCSTCGVCAYDLDHHCIYINNCVGYLNRRNFVLFMTWEIIGGVYALTMLTLAVRADYAAIAGTLITSDCELPEQFKNLLGTGTVTHGRSLNSTQSSVGQTMDIRVLAKLGQCASLPGLVRLLLY